MATYVSTFDGPLPLEDGSVLAKDQTVSLVSLVGTDAAHVEAGRLVLVTGPVPDDPYSYKGLRVRQPDGVLVRADDLEAEVFDPNSVETVVQPSGDTTGAADTTALQAALDAARTAGGGTVRGKRGGTFYLRAVAGVGLRVGTNTTLDMSECTTILAAGTGRMVENYGNTAVASATDGAMTSGGNVVTTALGAQAVVGQSVVVAGAGLNGNGPMTGKISARTSTTITLVKLDGTTPMNASATVSGASVQLFTRDRNVTVLMGDIDTGSVGGSGAVSNPNQHKAFFQHLDNLVWRQKTFSAAGTGYLFYAADVDRIDVDAPGFNSTLPNADGVHIDGPARFVHVRHVGGTTGDDLLALMTSNSSTVMQCSGDVTDVLLGSVAGDSVNSRHLALIAGPNCTIDRVTSYGQLTGKAGGYSLWIGDDTTTPAMMGGTFGVIETPKVNSRTSAACLVFLGCPTARRLVIESNLGAQAGSSYALWLNGVRSAAIDELVLRGVWDFTLGSTPVGFKWSSGSTTIKRVIFDRMTFKTPASGINVLQATGVPLTTVALNNCNSDGTGSSSPLVSHTSTAPCKFTITGCNFNGGSCNNVIFDASGQGNSYLVQGTYIGVGRLVYSQSGTIATIALAGVRNDCANQLAYANGGSLNVSGSGVFGTGALVGRAGTESIHVSGAGLSADLSLLARSTKGEVVNNTNAALSCGAGLCVSDGSSAVGSWKNLFTGSTY